MKRPLAGLFGLLVGLAMTGLMAWQLIDGEPGSLNQQRANAGILFAVSVVFVCLAQWGSGIGAAEWLERHRELPVWSRLCGLLGVSLFIAATVRMVWLATG